MLGAKIQLAVMAVRIRQFFNAQKSYIYKNRLKTHGINAFILDEHVSSLIPNVTGGVGLYVEEDQAEEAAKLLKEFEDEMKHNTQGDYREADMEDIMYEKSVYEKEEKLKNTKFSSAIWILFLVLVMGLAFYLNYFM